MFELIACVIRNAVWRRVMSKLLVRFGLILIIFIAILSRIKFVWVTLLHAFNESLF